ncbi:MAG: dUTP diphosphatase [Patescibacteria group bacterium]|nr:dUTP diphosphatase [Patescibacteria group bacterium]
MLKVRIQKINEDAKVPNYAHRGDAGMDFYSVEENYLLKPGERRVFSTGIRMEIPDGYVGLIWDKSGLAVKYGIKVMAGVIDSTYRGEVAVALINLGSEEYLVEKNAKIAQMLIQKIEEVEIETGEDLNITKRGDGGFGSTGMK